MLLSSPKGYLYLRLGISLVFIDGNIKTADGIPLCWLSLMIASSIPSSNLYGSLRRYIGYNSANMLLGCAACHLFYADGCLSAKAKE